MSAKIKGINAPPEWTYWTIEMAPPAVFVQTKPIGKAITYNGSILGEGIPPGGDVIREIRVFIDVNSFPVATFTSVGVIQDGENYLFDFETGMLSEGVVKASLLPLALISGGFAAIVLAASKLRKKR